MSQHGGLVACITAEETDASRFGIRSLAKANPRMLQVSADDAPDRNVVAYGKLAAQGRYHGQPAHLYRGS